MIIAPGERIVYPGEGIREGADPDLLAWKSFGQSDPAGDLASVHNVPDEAFVHALDEEGSCLCGPMVTSSWTHGDVIRLVQHRPLDVRYYKPGHYDGQS